MKNWEKYSKEILEVTVSGNLCAIDKKGEIVSCGLIRCSDCAFSNAQDSCGNKFAEWCQQEYKNGVAMISQPMADKSDEEIKAVREKVSKSLEREGYTVINTFYEGTYHGSKKRKCKHSPLYYLAKSLEDMSYCDTVYFCKGWENYRGCVIEHEAADQYGLKIIYEI